MIIAEVCVNVATNSVQKNFTYRVPERLKFLSAGWRVFVPFGTRKLDGFVMKIREADDATDFEFERRRAVVYAEDDGHGALAGRILFVPVVNGNGTVHAWASREKNFGAIRASVQLGKKFRREKFFRQARATENFKIFGTARRAFLEREKIFFRDCKSFGRGRLCRSQTAQNFSRQLCKNKICAENF